MKSKKLKVQRRKYQNLQCCLFTVAFLLGVNACAIPHVPARTVYEDPVNYVRLEEDPGVLSEWPPGHHSHPAVIGSERLRGILSGVRIQEHRIAIQRWIQGEAPLVPAFNDEELELLSVQVSEALGQAQYNERVTFYLSQPQTSARRLITSGGIYVQGTELHVILGNWQIIYGIPTYGMIYDRRYPMRPTAAKGFDLFFQPPEAVITVKSSWLDYLFANERDELVVDLSKIEIPEPVPVPLFPPVS
ncbi:MAG TPA: hypothetical protein VLE03_02490 [Nitrospiraceae bacterium]|nr:hypothetical protein [Nitrospiraceae bacterium]